MHGIAYFDRFEGIIPETFVSKSDVDSVKQCLELAKKRLMTNDVKRENVVAIKFEYDPNATEKLHETFETLGSDPVSKIAHMMN